MTFRNDVIEMNKFIKSAPGFLYLSCPTRYTVKYVFTEKTCFTTYEAYAYAMSLKRKARHER